jgi:DNA (cytosine-5)-methyltransferase 1
MSDYIRRVVEAGDGPEWTPSGTGLIVPTSTLPGAGRRRYARPTGMDLFCGAGGFSVGMHQAGFHVAGALETWPYAALTYMVNLAQPGVRIHFDTPEREAEFAKATDKHLDLDRPVRGSLTEDLRKRGAPLLAGDGWISGYGRPHDPADYPNEYLSEISEPPVHPDGCEHFWVADIRNVTGAEILDALELEVGELDVLFGGPPCQGFSAAGKRDVMDPRNSLVFEFCRLVNEMAPKTMVMENVPRMASMVTPEGLPVMDAIALALSEGGYASYKALQRALQAHPAARAVVKPRAERDEHDQDNEAEFEQGELFAEVG